MSLQEGIEKHLRPGQDFFGPTAQEEAAVAQFMALFARKDQALSVSRDGEAAILPEGKSFDTLLEDIYVEVDRLEKTIHDPKLVARKLVKFINQAAPDVLVRIEGVDGIPDSVLVDIMYVDGGGITVYSNVELYPFREED